MRRAVPVILATVGGLALMANFHTHPADVVVGTVPGTARAATAAPPRQLLLHHRAEPAGRRQRVRSGTEPERCEHSVDRRRRRRARPPRPVRRRQPASRTSTVPSSPPRYGDVQVRGHGQRPHSSSTCKALQLPSDRSRSARISQNAGPRAAQRGAPGAERQHRPRLGGQLHQRGLRRLPAGRARPGEPLTGTTRPPGLRTEAMWGTVIGVDVRDPVEPALIDDVFAWFRRVDDLFSTWRADSEISRLAAGDITRRRPAPTSATSSTCATTCRGTAAVRSTSPSAPTHEWRPRRGSAPSIPQGWSRAGRSIVPRDCSERPAPATSRSTPAATSSSAGRPRPGGEWQVGIQHPWRRDRVAAVVAGIDLGVATSGRYERGEHIIDPRTGRHPDGPDGRDRHRRGAVAGRRVRHGRRRPRRRCAGLAGERRRHRGPRHHRHPSRPGHQRLRPPPTLLTVHLRRRPGSATWSPTGLDPSNEIDLWWTEWRRVRRDHGGGVPRARRRPAALGVAQCAVGQ